DVILVCNQVGGHKDAALRQNSAESAFREWGFLLPWPKIIVGLSSNIHADECQLFLRIQPGRNRGLFFGQCSGSCGEQQPERNERMFLHQMFSVNCGAFTPGFSSRFWSFKTL